MTALLLENVTKTFGKLAAVRGIDLKVDAGERVALLGHNGAGKSTSLRMVLGLTPLTSGRIDVLGHAPGSRAARALTGYLPENVAFHAALTAREQLHHFARLKSVKTALADELLERVGLGHALNRRIRTYSKGMRQRVGLAQALLGQPALALLDEPTSGLDPISRHDFYDIVDDLAKGGTAVLLSSHALTDLETRTDRIAIMSKGKLVANASLPELRAEARLPVRLEITTSPDATERISASLGGTRMNGQKLWLTCKQDEKMARLGQILALGGAVRDVDVTPASLEELYRHYSGHNLEAP
ncbi:MAG: ABC transporter ATP-binding protein [Rhodobacteraceae bacterium]|nr:ABC transporter ATP-binding protein [Paracoccaceae bacterium]